MWLRTTIALLWAPKRMATWPASVTETSSPSRSTTIGSATSVSAGTSMSRLEGTSASTRAAQRVLGTRPLMPRRRARLVAGHALDANALGGVPGARGGADRMNSASACRPLSRLSGVKRQISSRPVGTSWSATSNEPAGWRWLSTLPCSGPCSSAERTESVVTVKALLSRFGLVTVAGASRHDQRSGGGAAGQPTAPSICSSIRRLSSRAYSIGSSLAIGSTKPRTIIAIASSCSMPRDMR